MTNKIVLLTFLVTFGSLTVAALVDVIHSAHQPATHSPCQ